MFFHYDYIKSTMALDIFIREKFYFDFFPILV